MIIFSLVVKSTWNFLAYSIRLQQYLCAFTSVDVPTRNLSSQHASLACPLFSGIQNQSNERANCDHNPPMLFDVVGD